MKSFFTNLFLMVLFLASTFTTSVAQDAWDYKVACMPSVLMVDKAYYMWYTGKSPAPVGSIGFASSDNGMDWTMYSGNPVLVHEPFNGWMEATVYEPNVIHEDSLFRMWYTSSDDPLLPGPIHIHHATSVDGLIWSKDTVNNPVISPGSNGSWDDVFVDSHCIIKVDTIYHMWYAGANGTYVRIGHATSPDGVSWTKDVNNPVLRNGTFSSWDYPRVEAPNVIFENNTYHMWYSGGDHSNWQIGYATSVDGVNWTKHAGNPVLKRGLAGRWDDTYTGFCSVLLDTVTSKYQMWYVGSDTSMIHLTPWKVTCQIGFAISEDGITWEKNPEPVVSEISNEITYDIPTNFYLMQNYPNPFNPSTTIEFQIPNSKFTTLKVYNMLGEEVATLVSRKINPGNHTFKFDSKNLASGVYYYQLVAGDFRDTKKMIILK